MSEEQKDYKFVVVAFDGQETAEQALKKIRDIRKEGKFKLEDVVAITKNEKGKVKLKQGRNLTGTKGAVGFGAAGLLAGTLLGGPLVGAAIGAALGSAGSQIKKEFNNDELKELGQDLDTDSSMLVLLVSDAKDDALEEVAQEFGGKTYAFLVAEEGLVALGAITEDEAFLAVIEEEVVEIDLGDDEEKNGEEVENTKEDVCPDCGNDKKHTCDDNKC
jgi:uncharacterized membrane protein